MYEAAWFVSRAGLVLSPQGGFASTAGGNQLTVDGGRRKLELIAGTASKIVALTSLGRPRADGESR